MTERTRRIGTIGTTLRVVVGLALLYLAVTDGGLTWDLRWHDVLLGLVVFPAVMVAIGLTARRFIARPIRFTGLNGILANAAVILVLVLNSYTAHAAGLLYGASLLVAAWRPQPDCEATVLSNWILRRDDRIGCPTFTPIDALDARHNRQPADQTSRM